MSNNDYKMFARWLKENNAWGKFVHEMYKPHNVERMKHVLQGLNYVFSEKTLFQHAINVCVPEEFIMNYISWAESKNENYWQKLYNEYKNYYRKIVKI